MSNTTLNDSNVNKTVAADSRDLNQKKMDTSTGNTPIIEQFNRIKQIFLVNDTANTFSQSLQLLFRLIKESMILVWLALCWGIVAMNWMIAQGKLMGGKFKMLMQKLSTFSQDRTKKEIMTEATQTFAQKSQDAMQTLVVEAKKQVGVQDS